MEKYNKAMLVILDGWGHGNDKEVSAISRAHTPFMDAQYKLWPNAELVTYGEEVGLPEGQMGNSEVGHLNIGAGRIVYQDFARINKAIADGSIRDNATIVEMVAKAKAANKPIHIMGLLSDGGVHSHINHITEFCKIATDKGITVYIHAFMDGRDTGQKTGKAYAKTLMDAIEGTTAQISTVIGRYYAMDRDNRWERIAKAYNLIVKGEGSHTDDLLTAIKAQYDKDITDEFMVPMKVGDADKGLISDGDFVLFANFRTDRPRQLTQVLTQKEEAPGLSPLKTHFVTLTQYDAAFKGINVVFTKDAIPDTLGEVVEGKGLRQLRIAETEKYPHVSFFFSGGQESPFSGEERILVSSPKVATYDLQPEMSAYEVTTKVVAAMEANSPDLIILNYANADMVGHTGMMEAAEKSVEVLDACMDCLVTKALSEKYKVVVIADHGNSDIMRNDDGTPHTAHTTNMVPIIVMDEENRSGKVENGILADVAPTILGLMGIEKSEHMTGKDLRF